MPEISLATDRADAEAARTLQQEHAELVGALTTAVNRLTATIRDADALTEATARAVAEFNAWSGRGLTPFLVGGEALHTAAAALPSVRAAAGVVAAARRRAGALSAQLVGASEPFAAVALARSLAELVSVIVAGEDEHLLPALAQAPGVSLSELIRTMDTGAPSLGGADAGTHPGEVRAGAEHAASGREAAGTGAQEDAEVTTLDVREVPHSVRHATIFGALDAVAAGGALDLMVHHDPIPLLMQLEQRSPGAFSVSYLERGPEVWRLRFRRAA